MIGWYAIAKENVRLVRVPVLIMDWIAGKLTHQGCENMAKEIDDIEEDDDLLQQFSDDDYHFDDDVFLSF